jgi:hypothetical protein
MSVVMLVAGVKLEGGAVVGPGPTAIVIDKLTPCLQCRGRQAELQWQLQTAVRTGPGLTKVNQSITGLDVP